MPEAGIGETPPPAEALGEELVTIARWLAELDWIITGGESGRKARDNGFLTNARYLRDQCRTHGVAFFGKQSVKKAPLPPDLAIQEFPHA